MLCNRGNSTANKLASAMHKFYSDKPSQGLQGGAGETVLLKVSGVSIYS